MGNIIVFLSHDSSDRVNRGSLITLSREREKVTVKEIFLAR